MGSKRTCDRCEHFDGKRNCAQMGDANDGDYAENCAVGWDYEGYRAGVYVGPKFGCIHWAKKPSARCTPQPSDYSVDLA